MKCLNCGLEYDAEYSFCPNCGTSAPIAVPVSLNPTADKVFAALKDNMFLAICVLISISLGTAIIGGSMPIIQILLTIFFWITFSKSRKGITDAESLRRISGTVYANYVLNNVAFGILIACGLLISVIFAFIPNTSAIIEELENELLSEIPQIAYISMDIILFLFRIIGPIIVIVAVAGLLINIFGMRKIHRFIKSVYKGIISQNPNFEYIKAAKTWMIVFGVWYAIDALGYLAVNFLLGVSMGCSAAALITASILVGKYFENTEAEILN